MTTSRTITGDNTTTTWNKASKDWMEFSIACFKYPCYLHLVYCSEGTVGFKKTFFVMNFLIHARNQLKSCSRGTMGLSMEVNRLIDVINVSNHQIFVIYCLKLLWKSKNLIKIFYSQLEILFTRNNGIVNGNR